MSAIFYGGQSKSPEYSYSFTDVAGFPDLTVQLILLFTLLSCPNQTGPSCSLNILSRQLFLRYFLCKSLYCLMKV